MSEHNTFGAQTPDRCNQTEKMENLLDDGFRMINALVDNIKTFNVELKNQIFSKINRYNQPGNKPPLEHVNNVHHVDAQVNLLYKICTNLEKDLASIEDDIIGGLPVLEACKTFIESKPIIENVIPHLTEVLGSVAGVTSQQHDIPENSQPNSSWLSGQTPPEPRTDVGLKCPVCLDKLKDPKCTRCGHIFCSSCIDTAMEFVRKCPLCKKRLMRKHVFKIYL